MSENNKPKQKFRAGQVSLTVWENDVKDKDFKTESFKIKKSYKDKDDKWQTTSNFNKQDLINVGALIDKYLLSTVNEQWLIIYFFYFFNYYLILFI